MIRSKARFWKFIEDRNMIEQALRLEAEMRSADLLGSLADLEKKTVDFASQQPLS